MQVRHNFGPENGPQHTAISNQLSANTHFLPPAANDYVAASENTRIQGSGSSGPPSDLVGVLRWWARHHNWYELDCIRNQLKLEWAFAEPIRQTANQFMADRRGTLARQVRTDFTALLDLTEEFDSICRAGCANNAEYQECQHTKAQLQKMLKDLADLIESGQRANRKIVDIPPADDGAAGCKKRRRRKPTKTKRTAGPTFKPWNEKNAACFTYQSGCVYFCCNKESKKIPFREDSQAPLVLGAFLDGPVSGEKIKGLTKATSGASQIVRNINRTINTRLRKIGFTDIHGMQFIYFDNGANAYRLKPDILEHALYLSQRENNFE